MSKRQKGHGSVEQYMPGRWRVRARVNGRNRTIASNLSYDQATQYADALASVRSQSDALTVAHLVELVKLERAGRADIKPSTLRGEKSIWSAIVAEFGDVNPRELDRVDIRTWLSKAKATSTRKNRLNLLRYVFGYAVDKDLVEANPCDGVKAKGKRHRITKRDLLEKVIWPEQQSAIIQELASPKQLRLSPVAAFDESRRLFLLACYLFSLGTGCRLSEMWGVKREDVSTDGILIARSEANAAPKSGDWRQVPRLPPTDVALEIMEVLRAQHPRLAASEWLFPGWRGSQRGGNKQPKGWAAVLEACGFQRRNWHWLRHTCATSLLAGWWLDGADEPIVWTLEELRALLGHASVTTTEIYATLLDDKAFDAARRSFQNRSNERTLARLNFEAITLSQLPELNRRPAVYETAGQASNINGLGQKQLQNWNDDVRGANEARKTRQLRLVEAGDESARAGLAISRGLAAAYDRDQSGVATALNDAARAAGGVR